MSAQEKYEKIVREYLAGNISREQLRQIEEELRREEDKKSEVPRRPTDLVKLPSSPADPEMYEPSPDQGTGNILWYLILPMVAILSIAWGYIYQSSKHNQAVIQTTPANETLPVSDKVYAVEPPELLFVLTPTTDNSIRNLLETANYYYRQHNLAKTLEIIQLLPPSADRSRAIGICYWLQGKLPEAIRQLEMALQQPPPDPSIQYAAEWYLAAVYLQDNQQQAGTALLQKIAQSIHSPYKSTAKQWLDWNKIKTQ